MHLIGSDRICCNPRRLKLTCCGAEQMESWACGYLAHVAALRFLAVAIAAQQTSAAAMLGPVGLLLKILIVVTLVSQLGVSWPWSPWVSFAFVTC